jgi:hypothetical protein
VGTHASVTTPLKASGRLILDPLHAAFERQHGLAKIHNPKCPLLRVVMLILAPHLRDFGKPPLRFVDLVRDADAIGVGSIAHGITRARR